MCNNRKIESLESFDSILKNATKQALRYNYNYYIYTDKNNELSFSKDITCVWESDKIIGIVKPYWENGILKTKYIGHNITN